jgi:hypothetical protein
MTDDIPLERGDEVGLCGSDDLLEQDLLSDNIRDRSCIVESTERCNWQGH